MKVMVIVKATPNSEKGLVVDEQTKKMFADMGKFNDELTKAGLIVTADGLKPSSHGKRIKITDGGHASVIDGPFAETKELVAGFWIWEVKSLDEAINWAKRCPNPMPGEEGVLEIRPFNTIEDFGDLLPDEQPKPKPKPKAKSKAKAKVKSKAAKRRPARARSKK